MTIRNKARKPNHDDSMTGPTLGRPAPDYVRVPLEQWNSMSSVLALFAKMDNWETDDHGDLRVFTGPPPYMLARDALEQPE